MKYKVLSILLVFVSLALNARIISKDEAMQCAVRFFEGTDSSDIALAWSGDISESPSFYVFNNRRGGFVVISGEEAVDPVLGYSREGAFSHQNMPSNIKAWFGSLEKDIATVRQMNIEPDAGVLRRWKNIGVMTKSGGEMLLETAQWGQGAPYNDRCVVGSGKKALTGCVATAMAIFLRYMKYPERGCGSLSSYTTGSDSYAIQGYSIDDHEYKWDMMPLKDSEVKSASEEQKEQIAQLMHDCGVMVQMDYGTRASGAYSGRVPQELAEHMGYNAGAQLHSKSMYSTQEWTDMLMAELDQKRPVYYSAIDAGDGGGHAFIVDGYDGNGRFHLNWGWNGADNGYFTLDLSVGQYRFSKDQDMIIGLSPDPDKTGKAKSLLEIADKGIMFTSGSMEKNSTFSLLVDCIVNIGNSNFNGEIVPAIVDENGNVKDLVCTSKTVNIAKSEDFSYYNIARPIFSNCKVSKPLSFSDRLVILAESEIVRHDGDRGAVGAVSACPYMFIASGGEYTAGDTFLFELITGNASYDEVQWYFDGAEVNSESVVLTSGTHTVKAVVSKASGRETLVQELVVR